MVDEKAYCLMGSIKQGNARFISLEDIRKEIQKACIGTVYTFEEFCSLVEDGSITSTDGFGRFHNGLEETDIDVYAEGLSFEEASAYPFVCWYNK